MTSPHVDALSNGVSKLSIPEPNPTFPEAYPTINPVDLYRIAIAEKLSEVTGVDKKLCYDALQWPQTLDKGDLTLPCPKLRIKGKPQEQAQQWAAAFPSEPLILPPKADTLNLKFEFAHDQLPSIVLKRILTLRDKYGSNPGTGLRDPKDPSKGRKKIIVEFSSPNIAKEFHVGHLRSTIIGGFLSNLYEVAGWEVIRMNYLGDWGRQYGLLAIGWQKYGSEELFAKDPIRHLFDVYVKISADFKPEEEEYKQAKKDGKDTLAIESRGLYGECKSYFKRMEEGDKDALQLWQRFRDLSIEKYKKSYARLNIYFDEYSGESQVKKESMDLAEKMMREKGLVEMDGGAWIIDFKKHGAPKLPTAVIRNRNNTTTYLLRDVGSAFQRKDKYHADQIIYVVMSEQATHLAQLYKILELLGGEYAELSKKMQHVTYGKVMGMSTRKGTVKFLDDILEEIGESMHDVMRVNQSKYEQVEEPEKVADTLGISSIMAQDMAGKRVNNYPFDIKRMTSFEGDTGPYLQYAHARLCSILRKVDFTHEDLLGADFSLLKESHAIDLCRVLAQWPDTVNQTLKTLEPTTILTYLFKMTHRLSSSYDILRVVNAPEGPEVTKARAALYEASRQVLHNGLSILGFSPLKRM